MTVKELKDLIDINKVYFIDIVSGKRISMPTNKDGSIKSNWEKVEIIKLHPTSIKGYTPMLNAYVDLKWKTLTLRELIDTMRLEFECKKWEIKTFEHILYTNNETIGVGKILLEDISKLPRDTLDDMIVQDIRIGNGDMIVVTVLPRREKI